ncbi:MAG: hypothetical protein ACOX4U_07965 [Anaerovoracaceae bacterium]|jgi:hypothetical protein
MRNKLKDDKYVKELLRKALLILLVAVSAFVLLNVLTNDRDGRRQIVSQMSKSTVSETQETIEQRHGKQLSEILETIKGVGKVEVMITYRDDHDVSTVFAGKENKESTQVKGVIVTAEGAGSPIVRSNIIGAVTAVFDIPLTNVMVFEKN